MTLVDLLKTLAIMVYFIVGFGLAAILALGGVRK